MRIAILINSLGAGGAERVTQTLANTWVRQGHQVLIATLHDAPVAYQFDPRVQISPLVRKLAMPGPLKMIALPYLAAAWRRVLQRFQPTHAFSLLPRSNLVNCLSSSFGNKHPIVISERTPTGLEYSGNAPEARLMRGLIGRLYPRAREVIAISTGVKASLQTLGIEGRKVIVIPNPQDLDHIRQRAAIPTDFPQLQPKLRIVNSGRLVDFKDRPTLLRAFALVRARLDAQLIVMGDGPLEAKLKSLAAELGVAADVWWAGYQPNPFALMRQCDLYVHSSEYEGFGNVLVEAMACGLPVIATNCPGGAADILEDKLSKYLVPVKDPQALAERIVQLLGDQQTRAAARADCEERCAVFEAERIAAIYLERIAVR